MASASRFCWPKLRVSGGRSRIPSSSARPTPAERLHGERIGLADLEAEVARTEQRAPRGPCARTASGSGSGRRSRTVRASSAISRPGRIGAIHQDAPGAGPHELHGGAEHRRLAGAVRAEDGDRARARPAMRVRPRRHVAFAERHVKLVEPEASRDRDRRGSRTGVGRPDAGGGAAAAGRASSTTSKGSLTAAGSATARNPSTGPRYVTRPSLMVEHSVRSQRQRLLDPVLDDDDGVARIGQGAEHGRAGGRPWRGSRLASGSSTT